MRVRWTTPAADELYEIVRHIQRDTRKLLRMLLSPCTMAAAALEAFHAEVARDGSKALANWFSPAFSTLLFTESKIRQ
jgi:hypothetical protein